MGYTNVPIPGRAPSRYLPGGTALVLEGGGTRGYYSAGVFEAFMDEGLMFPYIAAVSAGAANALSYISGQRGRNREIIESCVADRSYVSVRNLITKRSMFGFDFIFGVVPRERIFFDMAMFENVETRLRTGALDCETGETAWFEKEELDEGFGAVVASCSVPLLSRVAEFGGRRLLDGGVADAIPIERSIADGNTRHVVVLTRNAGYVKRPMGHRRFVRAFYGRYPKVAEALETRHEAYNRQLELCEKLEAEGRAVIIRPGRPLNVGRTERDVAKLLALHDEGVREGRDALPRILAMSGAE
jgi:predicted patatin/cPLA2 family phospholipase